MEPSRSNVSDEQLAFVKTQLLALLASRRLQALVGALVEDITNRGAAYVFTRTSSSWAQQAKLTAADAASEDRFGNAVAISGDFVSLSVCLGSCLLEQSLPPSPAKADRVCCSQPLCVVLQAVVGAYLHDGRGSAAGSAYVFSRASDGAWAQEEKLEASDGLANDQFGYAVAFDGETVSCRPWQGARACWASRAVGNVEGCANLGDALHLCRTPLPRIPPHLHHV